MAKAEITIGNNHITRVALALGYKPLLEDGVTPNPELELPFIERTVKLWLKIKVKTKEINNAQTQAGIDAGVLADGINIT